MFSTKRLEALAAAVAALAWITLLVKGGRKLFKGDGNDFTILFHAAERLVAGQPIYDGYYMYPPFFAYLLSPLVVFPVYAAGLIWLFLKIPIFHASVRVFLGAAGVPRSWRFAVEALAPVAAYRMLDSDCATGNVNVYLLGAVALAVYLIRTRPKIAGAVLGATAAVKLAPAYVLVALAAAGRWRTALTGIVTLAVLLVIPCLGVQEGVRGSFDRFLGTSQNVFDPQDIGEQGGSGYVPGQSLRAIAHRLLRPIDATAHDKGQHIAINLWDTDAATSETVYRVIAALLAIVGLWFARRRDPAWVVAWAFVIMLLISPYSRKAHFILLVPAFCFVLGSFSTRALGGVSWLTIHLTTRGVLGKQLSALATAYCPFAFASVCLLPAMLRWTNPLDQPGNADSVATSAVDGGSS